MKEAEIKNNLLKLVDLDIDAAVAYTQAILTVDEPSISSQLKIFRQDHERHIDGLIGELQKMGQKPPTRVKDFKGFFIQGFTSIRSSAGTQAALSSMQLNEKITNDLYAQAVGWPMPELMHRMIVRFYDDEKTHLDYINTTLDEMEIRQQSGSKAGR